MSELVLKVGPGSGYAEGDVLCAFNRRRIRCCHAQHICHVRVAPRNASGLVRADAIARAWFEATHQYLFERVSATELKRVTIATGTEELFGARTNERGESIDVRLFVRRRKRNPHCPLFGEDGAEFWYGGRVDTSDAKLDAVWNAIQTHTPLRESAFRQWPAGTQELRSHLFLSVNDFDDETAIDLESPELEDPTAEQPVVIARRKHRCDWTDRLALSAAEIERVRDRGQIVDLRDRPFARAAIIDRKPKR